MARQSVEQRAGEHSNVGYAYLHAKGLDNLRIRKGGYALLLPGKLRKLIQTKG